MSHWVKQINQITQFVGAKRGALHPGACLRAVPFNLINGTHRGSLA